MKRDQIWNLNPLSIATHMGMRDFTSLSDVKEQYELFQKEVHIEYRTYQTQTKVAFRRLDRSKPKKPVMKEYNITSFGIISPDATELVRGLKGDLTAWEEDGEQFISFGPYAIALRNPNPNYEASYKLHNIPYPGGTETPATALTSVTQNDLEYLDLA
jgi:hypothetical protein